MGEKYCFVLSPIGDKGSKTREWSEKILDHIITPVLEEAEYEVDRADMISEPGLITRQITSSISEADVVIADLTFHNPNVFYELAFTHTIEKPVVQMIKSGQEIPFDVSDSRTIEIEDDIGAAEAAKEELKQQLDSISEDFKPESPISVALDLSELRAEGDPIADSMADLRTEVSEIKHLIESNEIISDPEFEDLASGIAATIELVKEMAAKRKAGKMKPGEEIDFLATSFTVQLEYLEELLAKANAPEAFIDSVARSRRVLERL